MYVVTIEYYSAIKKKLNLANCDNINRPEGDCDYAKQS